MFSKKILAQHKKPEIPKVSSGVYTTLLYERYDDDTLIINIYHNDKEGKLYPQARMFLRKNEYITQDSHDIAKWYTGRLEVVAETAWYSTTELNTDIADEYLTKWGIDDYTSIQYKRINLLQECLLFERRQVRFNKEETQIDKELETFKELPKGSDKFLNKTALRNGGNYIFFNNREKNAYCTNCEHEFSIKKSQYKHKDIIKCPICQDKVTLLNANISHKYIVSESTGVIFQSVNGVLQARYFNIYKSFADFKNPKTKIKEVVRTIFAKDKIQNYEFRLFHNTKNRWCKCMPFKTYYGYSPDVRYGSHSIYAFYNLGNAIRNTEYKYSEVVTYSSIVNGNAYSAENYLEAYKKHNVLEKFVKVGLVNIAATLLNYDFKVDRYCSSGKAINETEKELHKILGLEKDKYTTLTSTKNPSWSLYRCIKNNVTSKRYSINEYNFINRKCKSERNCKRMFELLKITSYKKVTRYLQNKEADIDIFLDYVDFCKTLNWNLKNEFVLFPKQLKRAHDDADSLIKKKEKQAEIDAINLQLEEIAKTFSYKLNDFAIVAPKDAKELITESQTLHNCIARSYMTPFAKKQCIILFIRQLNAIDKPFYAMEIANNKVVQVRGINNCEATTEVKEFVEKFKKVKQLAA